MALKAPDNKGRKAIFKLTPSPPHPPRPPLPASLRCQASARRCCNKSRVVKGPDTSWHRLQRDPEVLPVSCRFGTEDGQVVFQLSRPCLHIWLAAPLAEIETLCLLKFPCDIFMNTRCYRSQHPLTPGGRIPRSERPTTHTPLSPPHPPPGSQPEAAATVSLNAKHLERLPIPGLLAKGAAKLPWKCPPEASSPLKFSLSCPNEDKTREWGAVFFFFSCSRDLCTHVHCHHLCKAALAWELCLLWPLNRCRVETQSQGRQLHCGAAGAGGLTVPPVASLHAACPCRTMDSGPSTRRIFFQRPVQVLGARCHRRGGTEHLMVRHTDVSTGCQPGLAASSPTAGDRDLNVLWMLVKLLATPQLACLLQPSRRFDVD
ncbi:unnamed protein product [Pleuronectes platessa]|uniref:Uncharacterized protein n=1 Tax=Pleuronectes platessa TaxID=8262 RepID=A0A9N7W0G4_PLEPL|nr:unnamed protein product [Pleuronectes platessa]